jgi:hypothetical protein
MFYDSFEVPVAIDIFSEPQPALPVVVGGRAHGAVVQQYFTQFHELIDLLRYSYTYDGLVVIVVQFKTYFSDILHVLTFVLIEIKQKFDQRIKGQIFFILRQGDKS